MAKVPRYFDKALLRGMASVGGLMFFGDAIVQQFEGKHHRSISGPNDRFVSLPGGSRDDEPRRWNVDRSLRLLFIGTFQQGPISHWTYVSVARLLPGVGDVQN